MTISLNTSTTVQTFPDGDFISIFYNTHDATQQRIKQNKTINNDLLPDCMVNTI